MRLCLLSHNKFSQFYMFTHHELDISNLVHPLVTNYMSVLGQKVQT